MSTRIRYSSHSSYDLHYHMVFVTKYRNRVLTGRIEHETKKVMTEICAAKDWELEEINVMPDHVHLLLSIPPKVALSDVARILKSISAVHIFKTFPKLKSQRFWGSGLWSSNTFYGSVGAVNEETVRKYIQNQKKK